MVGQTPAPQPLVWPGPTPRGESGRRPSRRRTLRSDRRNPRAAGDPSARGNGPISNPPAMATNRSGQIQPPFPPDCSSSLFLPRPAIDQSRATTGPGRSLRTSPPQRILHTEGRPKNCRRGRTSPGVSKARLWPSPGRDANSPRRPQPNPSRTRLSRPSIVPPAARSSTPAARPSPLQRGQKLNPAGPPGSLVEARWRARFERSSALPSERCPRRRRESIAAKASGVAGTRRPVRSETARSARLCGRWSARTANSRPARTNRIGRRSAPARGGAPRETRPATPRL